MSTIPFELAAARHQAAVDELAHEYEHATDREYFAARRRCQAALRDLVDASKVEFSRAVDLDALACPDLRRSEGTSHFATRSEAIRPNPVRCGR